MGVPCTERRRGRIFDLAAAFAFCMHAAAVAATAALALTTRQAPAYANVRERAETANGTERVDWGEKAETARLAVDIEMQ